MPEELMLDVAEEVSRWYQGSQGGCFEDLLAVMGGSLADVDMIADLVRADVQHRLAHQMELSLRHYRAVPQIGTSPELLDVAIQAIVHAMMARGESRAGALSRIRRENPECEAEIETAEALSKLLRSSGIGEPVPTPLPRRIGPKLKGGERRYELTHSLGGGSQAIVYRAIDHKLSTPDRPSWVAIKLWQTPPARAAEAREMIEEAIRARQIDHPNVVSVFDAGITVEGESYMVMPIVEGKSLHDLADGRGAVSARQIVTWITQVCSGVQAIHVAGLLHRDIKPKNILIDARGSALVMDLGLSIRQRDSAVSPCGAVGTPGSVAPEQWNAGRNSVSPAADTYAIGASLLWALTGQSPHGSTLWTAERALRFPAEHAQTLEPVLAKVADGRLRNICKRALLFSAQDRYMSAEGLASDLAVWLANEPVAWMKTGLSERLRLWARRAPWQVLAASVLVASSVLVPSAVLWAKVRVETAKAQNEITLRQEAEKTVSRGREMFKVSMNAMKFSENKIWRDGTLSSLLILEAVLGPFFTDENGLIPKVWSSRIAQAHHNREAAPSGSLESMHWGLLEGTWLMQDDQFEASREILADDLGRWEKICTPDDPWLADVRGLHAAASVYAMENKRSVAIKSGASMPDFDPETTKSIERDLQRITDDPRPTRRVYYLAANAKAKFYGPKWHNNQSEVSRLRARAAAPSAELDQLEVRQTESFTAVE